jgi:hypothetical protein
MRTLRSDLALRALSAPALVLTTSCIVDGETNMTQPPLAEVAEARPFGDSHLTNVRDLLPGTGDKIWVLDAVEPFVHLYRSDGTPPVSFGRAGRGVGEMLNPVVLLNDEPAPNVWDRGNHSRLRLSTDGVIYDGGRLETQLLFHARSDIQEVSYGRPFRARRIRGSVVTAVYPQGLNADVDFRYGRIVRVTDAGIDVLVEFQGLLGGEEATGRPHPRNLVGIPLWDVCPDGSIHLLDPYQRSLLRLTPNGSIRDTLDLPLGTETLESQHIRRYLRLMVVHELGSGAAGEPDVEREIERLADAHRDDFGEHVPPAADLLCDFAARTWIERFDNSADPLGYGRDWLVVEGDTFRRVRFPERFRPIHIGERQAIGILTDSLDVQRVATTEIPF